MVGMVEGFARVLGVHFLPDDRPAVDRALVAGRTLTDMGDSPLARALGEVVDGLLPAAAAGRPGRVRRRTAGRAHRR